MSLELHINDETSGAGVRSARLEACVRAALESGPPAGGRVSHAEISLTFLPGDAMRRLNREYHATDRPTDVLAFALDSPLGEEEDGLSILGDVYVCPDVAAESARELGIALDEEIERLAIHGVLHLMGHDHPEGEARYASPMFQIQERLLAALGD